MFELINDLILVILNAFNLLRNIFVSSSAYIILIGILKLFGIRFASTILPVIGYVISVCQSLIFDGSFNFLTNILIGPFIAFFSKYFILKICKKMIYLILG